jgi:hypothetical protein
MGWMDALLQFGSRISDGANRAPASTSLAGGRRLIAGVNTVSYRALRTRPAFDGGPGTVVIGAASSWQAI